MKVKSISLGKIMFPNSEKSGMVITRLPVDGTDLILYQALIACPGRTFDTHLVKDEWIVDYLDQMVEWWPEMAGEVMVKDSWLHRMSLRPAEMVTIKRQNEVHVMSLWNVCRAN